jgi:succinate semialdehyde reductase (NADPH)
VQVARALGAGRIIAIDLDDEKLSLARDLGATDTINASKDDPVLAARDLTGGVGVNIAFEAIGRPDTFRQATEAAADGGRCVMVGIAPVGLTAEIEITRLVRRKLQVLGSFGGRPRHDLPALMELAVGGELRLDGAIGARFSLDQADEAYSLLAEGRITGRAIVEM